MILWCGSARPFVKLLHHYHQQHHHHHLHRPPCSSAPSPPMNKNHPLSYQDPKVNALDSTTNHPHHQHHHKTPQPSTRSGLRYLAKNDGGGGERLGGDLAYLLDTIPRALVAFSGLALTPGAAC